jgi:hypothetical protein
MGDFHGGAFSVGEKREYRTLRARRVSGFQGVDFVKAALQFDVRAAQPVDHFLGLVVVLALAFQ